MKKVKLSAKEFQISIFQLPSFFVSNILSSYCEVFIVIVERWLAEVTCRRYFFDDYKSNHLKPNTHVLFFVICSNEMTFQE